MSPSAILQSLSITGISDACDLDVATPRGLKDIMMEKTSDDSWSVSDLHQHTLHRIEVNPNNSAPR